jgi:predicted 3-demethylubiquinone-9 3-methyltransferase (glyoxalase superfamily)
MGDSDPVKSKRVINAMLQMKKINVADLQKAYDGK